MHCYFMWSCKMCQPKENTWWILSAPPPLSQPAAAVSTACLELIDDVCWTAGLQAWAGATRVMTPTSSPTGKQQQTSPLAGDVTSPWCTLDIIISSKSDLGQHIFFTSFGVSLLRNQLWHPAATEPEWHPARDTACYNLHTPVCIYWAATCMLLT